MLCTGRPIVLDPGLTKVLSTPVTDERRIFTPKVVECFALQPLRFQARTGGVQIRSHITGARCGRRRDSGYTVAYTYCNCSEISTNANTVPDYSGYGQGAQGVAMNSRTNLSTSRRWHRRQWRAACAHLAESISSGVPARFQRPLHSRSAGRYVRLAGCRKALPERPIRT